MEGLIGFEQLRIFCVIGVTPEERLQPQEIFVDLTVEADFSRCALTDNLQETIDYRKIAHVCTQTAQEGNYGLLEHYASEVLKQLLESFPIHWAWIRIKKPKAIPGARWAFVELKRVKHG